jgi:hypothetical protein
MEEIEPLAKSLRLVIGLDSQSLFRVQRPETALQLGQDVIG